MTKRHPSRAIGILRFETLEDRKLLAAGALDKSFSGDGKATLSTDLAINATDVALQADGQTVVVGSSRNSSGQTSFSVARYALDGSSNLLVHAQLGNKGQSSPRAVAIAPNGKIVVVGDVLVNNVVTETEMGIAVFNPGGSPDKTFSGDGKQTFDLGDFGDNTTQAHDVVVQPDGKIIVVGQTFRGLDFEFAVIRMHPNGALDKSFDGDGKRTFEVGGNGTALAVKLGVDGTIYIAGQVDTTGSRRAYWLRLSADGKTTLAQAAFTLPGSTKTEVQDLILQPGGKVVIAGHALTLNGGNNFFVARFNSNGTLDTTFGGLGKGFAITDLGGNDTVAGITHSPSGGGFIVSGGSGGMAAVKYTDNGLLDPGFGTGGKVRLAGFGGVANIATGPGRRVMLAGGANFSTARLLLAGANVVAVGALDTGATEGTSNNGSLIIGRTERLSTPTRVFLNISGTALPPSSGGFVNVKADYSVPGVKFGSAFVGFERRNFVDIPANETFVIIPFIPRDDTVIEGTETAIFSVAPDPTYEIGTPVSGTIDLIDNEVGVTTNLSGVNDAYVRDGTNANTNFGSANDLQVKTGAGGFNRLSYIKFDLTSVNSISSAKLQLFGNVSDTQNTSIAVSLFPVADNSWTGSTINFNNKPTPGTTALASATVTGTTRALYQFDVTNYVKQEKAQGRNLVSFLLKSPATSASFVSFVSGNAGNSQPKLLVVSASDPVGTFAVATPPANVQAGKDTNIAVTWTVPSGSWRQLAWVKLLLRDLDDANSFAEFKFEDSTKAFYAVARTGVLTSPAVLNVTKSSVAAAGPASPSMTTNFVFHFHAAAAGHRFAIEVSARNDSGKISAYSSAGAIQLKR